MGSLLNHPAVQAAVLPLIAALVIAVFFRRSRLAWLGVVGAYVAMLLVTTGISFTPLSASRKVLLLVLLSTLIGLLADLLLPAARRWVAWGLSLLAALTVPWVFWSVLARAGATGLITGVGLAALTAALVLLVASRREDGVCIGAAGLGLGLAAGISALLSASTGYFMAGLALAAGAGALLALQLATGRSMPAGFIGALPIGFAPALFASSTMVLAELPPLALALMLLVPLGAVLVPRWLPGGGRPRGAVVLASAGAALAALLPISVAWLATRQAA